MIAETHPVTPEELMAYQDGEQPPARAEFLAGHLRTCIQCQDMDRVLRSASQTLASWTVTPASQNSVFEPSLSERASKSTETGRRFTDRRLAGFGRRHPVLSAGLGVSAALAISFVAVLRSDHKRFPEATLAMNEPMTPQRSRGESVFLSQPATPAAEDYASETPQMAKEQLDATMAQRQALLERLQQAEISSNLANPVPTTAPVSAPMIAHSVSLSIVVKNFEASRMALDAVVARHHGYAATLTANTQQNAARSLQASLRVPAGELASAVGDLKALGHIENESQTGEEVTQQHADLVARLRNSRETEQRLQAILVQRTGKIGDVLSVEQEVARVRGEIEQMEAERKSLEHRVDFATIDLNLGEEYQAHLGSESPSIVTRMHNAGVAGYRSAIETVIGVVLFFAEYGPTTLVCVTLVAPLGWFLRQWWKRAWLAV